MNLDTAIKELKVLRQAIDNVAMSAPLNDTNHHKLRMAIRTVSEVIGGMEIDSAMAAGILRWEGGAK